MNVILIERYPAAGRALSRLLEHERPDLRFRGQAYSAQLGIELAAQVQPELIVLEPLLFGHQPQTIEYKLTQLKNACPKALLIAVSSSDNAEHIRTFLRLGGRDYIYKPLQHQELLLALQRCCDAPETPPGRETALSSDIEYVMQTVVQYIHQGDEEAALHLLQRGLRDGEGSASAYSERCIQYIEIATRVIHLPESIEHIPDELIVLYQDFIKSSSQHGTLAELDESMDRFVSQSASIFNSHTRDHGYHQIQDAARFVDEHLGEDLSLQRLSSELYISTSYFSRLFKAKTGMKFSEYLAERRIERAKLLLVSTDTPITEIARQVGYPETNSFSRLFKKKTGQTPVQYRKREK